MKKNRIIALLLAILMVFGTVPGSVFAQEDTTLCEVCGNDPCTCESTGDESGEESAQDCSCNLENGGTHVATCPNYVCPNCGGLGYHEVCPETEEPVETTLCETCGNDPCTCESTGDESGEESAQDCSCNLENGGTHVATCPNYVCPDCGTAGWHETCPETDTPTETTPCEVCGAENCTTEHVQCDICGKFETGADPCICEPEDATDSCPYCDFYFTEDGTLLHGLYCNAEYAYDGTADVGKFLQLIEAIGSCNISDGSDFDTGGMEFYFDEFLPGTVMHITDWYWDSGTTGLWYAVTFASGGIAESVAEYWPETPWVLYDYTDITYEYDESLEFIRCPVCGNQSCKVEHFYCEICGKSDCAVKHAYCGVCGTLDCPTEHVYCHVCRVFDCGISHEKVPEEDHTPLTAPVIPEDPQLPEEYTVAVVDGSGNTVTEESGLLLAWNEKASLSAWSALGEDVSYQWQIFINQGDGIWVDITGQTGKGILFSRAMLMSALDEDNSALLRCVTGNGAETAVSEEICVTVVSPATDTVSLLSMRSTARSGSSSQNGGIALAADDPNPVYVSVTINYWDENSFGKDVKTPLKEPYIANILQGSPFNSPVISPPYLGYAAYYDADGDGVLEDGEMATSFNPNLLAVSEDTVFDLYYLPIEVPVAIRYFFQNINDDGYTENTSYYYPTMLKTGTIVSDEYLENCLKEKAAELGQSDRLAGFSKMHHKPEPVAADGSTVFECYYDRNYYMIAFALSGGFGIEPVYARFETPVLVNNPVKPGYSFLHWDQMPYNESTGVFEAGDGNADTLPTILPAENRKYSAVWKEGDTTYTVLYWLVDGESDTNRTDDIYIGSANMLEITGKEVSGSDSLGSLSLCDKEEHTHTDECGLTCSEVGHTHSGTCFDSSDITIVGEVTNVGDKAAFEAVNLAWGFNPDETYLYFIQTSGDMNSNPAYNRYWPKLYVGGKLHDITVNGSYSIYESASGVMVIAGSKVSATSTSGYTAHRYTVNPQYICGSEEHIHGNACGVITCGKTEHTHDSCPAYDDSRLAYIDSLSDKNIEVKGDGSTILNVYYKYKDYTLRFYYGRSYENGTDTVYQVVGGSTNPFGSGRTDGGTHSYTESTPVSELLGNIKYWGAVTELPDEAEDFNDTGKERVNSGVYTLGEETFGVYTYYYLQFTAPYDSNLENLWPVDIFNELDIVGTHSQTSLTKAYFSAWNGEYKVKYTQDHDGNGNNGNETIKGLYLYLDDNLLYDTTQFSDGTLVSYLCFWENGASVGWSIPEKYQYRLWLKPLSAPKVDDVVYSVTTYNDYTDSYLSAFDGYILRYSFNVYDNSSPGEQTDTFIRGYKMVKQENKTIVSTPTSGEMEHYIINYFYSFGNYLLELHNVSTMITVGSDIEYGTKLKDILIAAGYKAEDGYAPDFPSGSLEEGGYYFEGWYTTKDFTPGTKVDFETAVMPYNDLILHARWLPKTHTVQFFYNLSDLQDYNSGKAVETYTGSGGGPRYIAHGMTVGESDTEHPLINPDSDHDDTTQDEHMIFVRWFYLENGKKVAFSPDDTPVKKDLNVYAEWRDKRIQSFRISYMLLGEDIKIADDEFGYAYMSSTRTFDAKVGDPENQLYDLTASGGKNYNTGYFPIAASHSITMKWEENLDEPVHNVYTFHYTKASNVTYKVRYVNAVSGALIDETEAIDAGGKNVVTVRYKAYDGYTPDAFYKRLVLSVKDDGTGNYVGDDDANIVTFYYTPNSTSARYVIHYMTETLTENVYTEDHSVEGIGTVDTTVTVTPTNIAGFKLLPNRATYYNDGVKQTGGWTYNDGAYTFTVTMEGSELYLYFERLSYDYAVYYYLYGGTTPVKDPLTGSALYGSSVTATAPKVEDYTLVSAQSKMTITIREESAPTGTLVEPVKNVKLNRIIFYYMPKQYVVDYIPLPTEGGRIFPSTRENLSGVDSVAGVTWAANPLYEFGGWYLDEACTQPVDNAYANIITVDGVSKLIPVKAALSDTKTNTFYAKFNLLADDFTITKENARPGQVFVYRVVGENGLSIEVTVVAGTDGSGSTTIVDLPFGNYTVMQQNNWSWRYISRNSPTEDTGVTKVHSSADGVTFSDTESVSRWLSGISNFIKRIFGGT